MSVPSIKNSDEVSRFARNTRDSLQFMRELMRLCVTIQFEKENIDTGKLSTEQVVAIYAAFAQMESTGHSSNMRTSVRMRMENGIFTPSSMPYGYRLNGLGVERGHGQGKWYHHTISDILTNPAYTGNAVWNKSFRADTIPFPMVLIRGQRPKYAAEGSHPAIISQKDFQCVQNLIAVRKEQFASSTKRTDSAYFKRIFCGECGTVYRRKINSGKPYWVCNRHNTGSA